MPAGYDHGAPTYSSSDVPAVRASNSWSVHLSSVDPDDDLAADDGRPPGSFTSNETESKGRE